MSSFGKRVSSFRKQREFTQAQVADKMNISLHTYRQIEYQTDNPRMSTLKRLMDILNVTLDQLYPDLCSKTSGLSKTEQSLLSNFHQLKSDQQEAVLKLIQSFT